MCSGVNILEPHIAESLFIWTKPELMPMDLAIYWTVRRLSSKIIWWMASTCPSVIEVFFFTIQAPLEFSSSQLTSSQLHRKGSHQQVLIPCLHGFRWLSYFSFANTLRLLWSLLCSFLDLSHSSHLFMDLICAEIWTEIWISFLVL